MDLYDAIRNRCSVREYDPREIEEAKLRRVLDAGRLAPSGRNRQKWKFVVVRDGTLRSRLADAAEQPWLANVPAIIAVVGLTPEAVMHCDISADAVDCAIAIDHMTLAATAEGLGTCWIGHFDQSASRAILDVPGGCKIVEMLTIGYPAGELKTDKPRKSFDEVVCYDRFR